MSGWEQLIRAATETAGPVEWLPSLDGGSLVLTPVDSRGLDPELVRGTVAAARALSREICDACGGPGDPVWPAGGRGGTRCAGCRGADDEVLPRGEWRRERDPEAEQPDRDAPWDSYRGYRVLEDHHGFEAVMDARYHPDDERGWFHYGMIRGGWSHLLRAAFTLLVHEQSAPTLWRLRYIKEKFGSIDMRSVNDTEYHAAIRRLVGQLSGRTCYRCGRPGTPRREGWWHPACDPCEADYVADEARPYGHMRRRLAQRRRFQGIASLEERRRLRSIFAGSRRRVR